jgi:uncharacterized protein (TIGR03067 family)
MRTIFAVLVAGLVGFGGVTGAAADEKKAAPKVEGTYTIVAGKKDGADVGDKAKETPVKIDAKTIILGGKDERFVIDYKLDGSATPAKLDLVIREAPAAFADAKGAKAYGILAQKGDTVKLAYSLDPDGRPKDFSGKSGFAFELKKK